MNKKLVLQLFYSGNREDMDILLSLINTHDELFEAIWIIKCSITFSDCYENKRSFSFYSDFLDVLETKFNEILREDEIDLWYSIFRDRETFDKYIWFPRSISLKELLKEID